MIITIFEYNGAPIEATDRAEAKRLMTSAFDTLEEELGKCGPDNAQAFQKRLIEMVDKPISEMPISKEYKFDSPDALPIIVEELGGSVTLCIEEDKLVGYIATTEED